MRKRLEITKYIVIKHGSNLDYFKEDLNLTRIIKSICVYFLNYKISGSNPYITKKKYNLHYEFRNENSMTSWCKHNLSYIKKTLIIPHTIKSGSVQTKERVSSCTKNVYWLNNNYDHPFLYILIGFWPVIFLMCSKSSHFDSS